MDFVQLLCERCGKKSALAIERASTAAKQNRHFGACPAHKRQNGENAKRFRTIRFI